jgi:antitoxin PrlF
VKSHLSTLSSKGQVTIPAEVRRHLGLKKGERILFVIEPEGGVRLVVPEYPTIDSLRGIAGTLPHPMSWSEVKAIAREDHVAKKLGRERG